MVMGRINVISRIKLIYFEIKFLQKKNQLDTTEYMREYINKHSTAQINSLLSALITSLLLSLVAYYVMLIYFM